MFPLKVIQSEADYNAALKKIHELTERDADGLLSDEEGNYLDVLTVLVHTYEQRTSPVPAPDAIEAIQIRMKERGLRQRDLIPMIGKESIVSEVLHRKRRLTVPMIVRLSKGLNLPAEVLLPAAM